MASKPSQPRFEELDSLRGLAAFIVWSFHLIILLPASQQGYWWDTPFTCGTEAVRLFFVLSGFVLTLPFLTGPVSSRGFLLKRFFRIWPTYMAAIASVVALDGYYAISNGHVWRLPSASIVLQHAVMIDSFNTSAFIVVVWSLVYEMRISLLFPWIVRGLLRLSPLWNTIAIALAFLLGGGLSRLSLRLGHPSDLPIGILYLGMFMVGIQLARHRESLVGEWSKMPAWGRVLALLGATALFTFSFGFVVNCTYSVGGLVLREALVTLAAAVFIIAALSPGGFRQVLGSYPLRYMGRISYSFYLFHDPILHFFAYLGPCHLKSQPVLLAICSLSVSLLVATMAHYLIEKPTITVGRRLAARWIPRLNRDISDAFRPSGSSGAA